MDSEVSFSQTTLPIFNGENYDLWVVKMEAYLEALDLWEVVEEDYEVLLLPDNLTMAQIKNHKGKKKPEKQKKNHAFLLAMKESGTIKEYSNKLLSIANKIRLLDSDFVDSRIVENFLVMVPKRYEASITSLENSKDLSKITLAEVLHVLMAQEQ
ncbi:hypothetical protein CR513_54209, partial [Mucuna pruriens]